MVSNVLYKQVDLRVDVCRALQNLVDSNSEILALDSAIGGPSASMRVSKVDAQKNLDHLATFAGNLLAVLFNVYSQNVTPISRFYSAMH